MKTKQKPIVPLSLKVLLNVRGNPYLIARSGMKSFRIKNIKSVHALFDILLGSMMLIKDPIEVGLDCIIFTRGPRKWILQTKRKKEEVQFNIIEEYYLTTDGVMDEKPTLEVHFEWSGTSLIFQQAIDEMLTAYPEYKVFSLITPKSIV